ncbi:hypothetical protein K7432_004220 [Basidiobolus ranarum]|uniref:BCAS3 WD40 domain-containing protein n=1 Tax=Basidiobolus ranarum TaxID=34480 RepID=A0ABR2WYM5_9FUNG
MTRTNESNKLQKYSGEAVTSTMRVKAEPKYFRDPTSLHSISSVLHGISTYVAHSLPESLSRVKRTSIKLDSPYNTTRGSPGEGGMMTPERKKTVTYASFSWITGQFSHNSTDSSSHRRLCLLLGYTDGFQIWDLTDTDNICEAVSFRDQSEIRSIEVLPNPIVSDDFAVDDFQDCRALLAYVTDKKDVINGEEHSILNFFSLKNHNLVKTIEYDNEEISGIKANERAVIVLLKYTAIDILSPFSLERLARFTDIYCHPITGSPVVALGYRLLAYGTSTPPPVNSRNPPPNAHAPNFNVERVAKEMMNGVKSIGEYGYKTLSNYLAISPPSQGKHSSSPKSQASSSLSSGSSASENRHFDRSLPEGMVIVRDLLSILGKKASNYEKKQNPPIAHFQAHHHAIAALAFNMSGSLLVTASIQGTSFQVFGVNGENGIGHVKHLYKLARGYTSAHVEDIVFSPDSKWLAVSTGRGTTHIYAINPYGGPPNVSSHVRSRIENERGQPNRSLEETPHVSLSSIARIKQKHYGLMDMEMSEYECLPDGSPGVLSYSPTDSSFHQQIQMSPITLFIDSHESSSPVARRGSESMPSGQQDILTFSKNGILTLHRLDTTAISLRKKKQGIIVNTFELSVSGEDIAEWNLFRGIDWPSVTSVIMNEKISKKRDKKQWLSQTEISTYHIYEEALWNSSQFTLQTFDSESFKIRTFQPYAQARNVQVRKDMPIPYGVYIPKKAEDDDFSSEYELEGDLSNAIDSSLISLPLISNKSNEIQIPTPVRSKNEGLSFDDLNFVEIEDISTHDEPEQSIAQTAVDDLEFLGYLNEESKDRNVPDEEILEGEEMLEKEEDEKYPADSPVFMETVISQESKPVIEQHADIPLLTSEVKKSRGKHKKGRKN